MQCRDSAGNVWILNVDIQVPCPVNEVIREPYPRALVSEPTFMGLLPAEWSPSASGLWSDPQTVYDLTGRIDADGDPLEEGLVKNVQFGLRGQRLPKGTIWIGMTVPDVNWYFTGNSSNGSPRSQEGFTATYSYAAASYVGANASTGAVANKGRRFDFANRRPGTTYDLPAYPVRITTYCGFWHSIKLEQSVRYWQALSACFATYQDEEGNWVVPAGFSDEGCPPHQIAFGEWRFRWEPYVLQPWRGVDMRMFGGPTTYVPMTRATGGGIFKNVTYMEPSGNGVWVPVVEVQTVQQEN